MCPTCGCSHAEIKRDAARWQSLQLIGYQTIEADETGPAEVYECRNTVCGSTLLVQVSA